MKKIFTIVVLAAIATLSAVAQPKAVGLRGLGYGSLDASYEHTVGPGFIEANLGFDYFYSYGFKASALYNYMIAQPAWTSRGTWGIYAGAGLSAGYVGDCSYGWGRKILSEEDIYNGKYHNLHAGYGAEISFPLQAGLEYTFWFPLQLSVDIRPYIGMHILNENNGGGYRKVNFYSRGLLGFIPTISVRYAF